MKPSRLMQSLLISIVAAVLVMATATATEMAAAPWKKRHKLAPLTPILPGEFGQALGGLSATELAAFNVGRTDFQAVETPEGGLGPIFNDRSCAACHTAGGLGGGSNITVTRFGHSANGVFNSLDHLGGSLLQAQAIHPDVMERVPAEANVVSLRLSTPIFGAGLIEAIADETIKLQALHRQADGVQGRVSLVHDVASGKMRVGRFGWKAQQATLLAFSGDAYLNELGITSRLFPTENAPNGNTILLAEYDKVPDVEDTVDPSTGKGDIDFLADFMRFLAPPPMLHVRTASAGAALFQRAQCSACHVPMMFTAANSSRALSYQPVPLYSDLLLHDMGRLGDGIEQASATAREIRTAPLWGLRARTKFLHDGRASTVQQAIQQHDGTAAPSRQRFDALKPAEKQQLLDFLQTI